MYQYYILHFAKPTIYYICKEEERKTVIVIDYKLYEREIKNDFFFIDSHPKDKGIYHHEDNGYEQDKWCKYNWFTRFNANEGS